MKPLKTEADLPPVLSVSVMAEYLGVAGCTVRKAIAEENLPVVKIGTRLFSLRDEFLTWLHADARRVAVR